MVNTGINPALLRPQTFHVITYLLANRALVPIPQRLCLIGVQSAAATALPNVVIDIDDPSQTDGLFGPSSNMALLAREAFATIARNGQGPALTACPVAEGATSKATTTATITGTATGDGNLVITVAGRTITAGVANDTAQNDIASALALAAQLLQQTLPTIVTVATHIVTFTDACKGAHGNDTVFTLVSAPPGVTCVFAQTLAGVGASDLQPSLDAIVGQDFDGIAVCNHTTADTTEISAQLAETWTPEEKKPRWFFIGEPGSIGTATTLAAALDHEGGLVINWEGSPSLPGEIATAAACAALSKTRPNANYDGMVLPLYPPPIASAYTTAEIETALNAGITPLYPVVDPGSQTVTAGVGVIVRMITTRTSLNSQPFTLTRDLGISRTAWALAKQYDIAYANKFGGNTFPDGVLLDQDTEDLIRDMVIGINYAAQDANWIKNVDNDKALLVVEEDGETEGRVNVDNTYTIVVGLHQIAFVHRAQVG